MASSRRRVLAALLLLTGACAHVRRPPEESWPQVLDFRRLPRERLREWTGPWEMLRGPGAYHKPYHQPGPLHGGIEVTVIYVPFRDEFYLWENCAMGHLDAPLGPFPGDPRKVLRPSRR